MTGQPLAGLEGESCLCSVCLRFHLCKIVCFKSLSLMQSTHAPKASAEEDKSNLLPSWETIHTTLRLRPNMSSFLPTPEVKGSLTVAAAIVLLRPVKTVHEMSAFGLHSADISVPVSQWSAVGLEPGPDWIRGQLEARPCVKHRE